MYCDYHNHTILCHHARGSVDEYLSRAQEAGLLEFGFAEHSYWMVRPDGRNLCPSREETEIYLRWMDERREAWDGRGGTPILRAGLEADWVPERIDEALAFVDSYPFDHVLGSVHHIRHPLTNEWVCAWWFGDAPVEEVYATYFREVGRLAESGLCDILAHLDVIRRSMQMPADGIMPYFEQALDPIVRSGVAVEINASGRDHPNGDFFPCPEILRALIARGVPITFGSDGHNPTHVGRYRHDVVAYLRECGGTEFVRFQERKAIATPLPEFSLP